MKRLVIDLDGTITRGDNSNYSEVQPNSNVVDRMRQYKSKGFEIVIHTSRNMRTYEGNPGKITANTVPIIIEWLNRHDIPYDEIWVGKPWCGFEGFYVDDRALRPDEFANMSLDEINNLLGGKQVAGNEE